MPSIGPLLKAVSRAHVQRAHRRSIEQVLSGLLAAMLDCTGHPHGLLARIVPDDEADASLLLLAHTDPCWAYGARFALDHAALRRAAFGTNVETPGNLPSFPVAEHGLVLPMWFDHEPVGLLALSGGEPLSESLTARLEDMLSVIAVFLEEDRNTALERRALRRLQRAEARQRAVVHGAIDGILLCGADGVVLEANGAAERLFCEGDDGLRGRPLDALLTPMKGATGRHTRLGHTPRGPVRLDVTSHTADDHGEDLQVLFVRDCTAAHAAEVDMQRLNDTLRRQVDELARLNRENEVLGQFSGFLQACDGIDDVFRVLERFLPELFPGSKGTYNVLDGKLLEQELVWGGGRGATVFSASDCWAFRRGDVHQSGSDVCCNHLPDGAQKACCMPIMTGDGALGMLHLEMDGGCPESAVRMLRAVADRLGASLTNLMLRDRLRQESIRDPLTRLFNRRYMMETLERELARARRASQSVAVIMMDVDHFKRLNDNHGHDVGDQVLQAIASEMASCLRTEDVVCRYGGEEFVAILPGAKLELAKARADELRLRLSALRLSGRHGPLPAVTVSAGVAVALNNATPESVLRAADRALLRAKQDGRDQVCISVDGVVRSAA